MVREAVGDRPGLSRGAGRLAPVHRRRHLDSLRAAPPHRRPPDARACGPRERRVGPGGGDLLGATGTAARPAGARFARGDVRRVNRTRIAWDAIASGAYILTTRRAY